jgi:tetratricopeptide (TPR) repeat protein
MSWFSSWTTTSAKTYTTSPKHKSVTASGDDDHNADNLASVPSLPLSPQTSAATSIQIDRGMAISPKREELRQTLVTHESMPPSHYLQKRLGRLVPSGGCMPVANPNNSRISPLWTSSSRIEKPITANDNQIDKFLLPPYPDLPVPMTETNISASRNDVPLLEKFPSSQPAVVDSKSTSDVQHTPPQRNVKCEWTTFPGFALYQTAKAQYCQGRYSQALDTTTECLAFQKSFLNEHEGGSGNLMAALAASNTTVDPNHTTGTVPGIINGANAASIMTHIDLRSAFVTHVGSSVLGAVLSLKPESPKVHLPHPMLSNSIAIMISQYPSHHCVVKTLLLRGHVLAACGLDVLDNDLSLIVQAARNVEMAVAIQRKLAIDEELATPLVFLGIMKARLGRFNEAEIAYREAVGILSNIRSNAKNGQFEAQKSEDAELVSDCAMRRKMASHGIAHAFYLRGKAYHCQQKFIQAFYYYNKALILMKKTGSSRDGFGVKNIARCMKNSYALEKLVSGYWDDNGAV